MTEGIESEGLRIAQEWDDFLGGVASLDRHALVELAQRIDAALAERDVVFECPACGLVKGRIHNLSATEAKLAEREAQISVLWQVVQDFVTYAHRGNISISGLVFEKANHVLADTAHAARAFIERIQVAERDAIRALPPRRGT